jgi:hypothetical protein
LGLLLLLYKTLFSIGFGTPGTDKVFCMVSKLESLRELAKSSNSQSWVSIESHELLSLLAVVDAANEIARREELGGFGFEAIPKLILALMELES